MERSSSMYFVDYGYWNIIELFIGILLNYLLNELETIKMKGLNEIVDM